MKEKLVEFKTAKLARKKGFNWKCLFYRQKSAVIGDNTILEVSQGKSFFDWNSYNMEGVPFYSMPTQSLLQKWLREVHGIFVNPCPHYNFKTYGVEVYSNKELTSIGADLKFKAFEEAFEEGLYEALKLIKK